MRFKKVEREQFACTPSDQRPFGCMELWAGNERAHRSLELAGLESDVIAVPSDGDKGGDLSAVFSCTDNLARVVLADCVGHGYTASGVARHVHHRMHKFQDIRDTEFVQEMMDMPGDAAGRISVAHISCTNSRTFETRPDCWARSM